MWFNISVCACRVFCWPASLLTKYVPSPRIFSTGCEVETAMTLAPLAMPALMPDGLSSKTTQFLALWPILLAARMKGSG